MAGAESFANAYNTYEPPFGDGGIIPMPAGAATHGGDSPSFSQIMKLNSADRQPWEDAMSKEIDGLRQAGAIESEEICKDSLPSWDGSARPRSLTACGLNTTKRGPDGEVIRCKLRCIANNPKSKREIRSPGLATFSPSVRHSSLKCKNGIFVLQGVQDGRHAPLLWARRHPGLLEGRVDRA